MSIRPAFLLLLGAFTQPAVGAQESDTNAVSQEKALVSADWLFEELGSNTAICLVDLAHRVKDYNEGHIPGAQFVDWRSEIIDPARAERYVLPPKDGFERLLSKLGVQDKTTIVLTDNMDSRPSVRMYWTLKYYGHADVRVLNGGTDAWRRAGRELTDATQAVPKSNYKITVIDADVLTELESVRQQLSSGGSNIIDGRPTQQYTGEAPGKVFHTGKEHRRRGHIESAVNLPWSENLKEDGTFKSLTDLRSLYAGHGIKADQPVITYCNEGLHATMPWFVLHELLGRSDVKVYDDSLAEWANRDDTPMEKGK